MSKSISVTGATLNQSGRPLIRATRVGQETALARIFAVTDLVPAEQQTEERLLGLAAAAEQPATGSMTRRPWRFRVFRWSATVCS